MGIDRCLRRLRRLKTGVRRCEMEAMVCFASDLTIARVARLLPG